VNMYHLKVSVPWEISVHAAFSVVPFTSSIFLLVAIYTTRITSMADFL
jgi:hypothetical protein